MVRLKLGAALAVLTLAACAPDEDPDTEVQDQEVTVQELEEPEEAEELPAPTPMPAEDVPGEEQIPDEREEQSTIEPRMDVETARCVIGPGRYNGPCAFTPQGGQSFAISRADQSPLYGNVLMIGVNVLRPDMAEVRALTDGASSLPWGTAQRSEADPACWEGSDFSVCVY